MCWEWGAGERGGGYFSAAVPEISTVGPMAKDKRNRILETLLLPVTLTSAFPRRSATRLLMLSGVAGTP